MLLSISRTNNTIKNATPRNTNTNAKNLNKFTKISFINTKDKRYETKANAKNTIRFLRTKPILVLTTGFDVLVFLETCLLGALFDAL